MKAWEKLNDAIHDIGRGIGNWGHRDAAQVADRTYDENTYRAMDRGIVNDSMITQAKDYEKVSHSPSVKSLLRHFDNYEAAMKRMRIPERQEDGANADQKFMNEMGERNGEVLAYMQEMMDYLTRKAQGYAQKSKRYQGVMDVCISAATKIRTQMDIVNKIQENCFYAVRHGKEVPYGESYADLLMQTDIFQEKDDTDRTVLGSGGVNTVYLVEDNERNTRRVLKEGQAKVKMKNLSGEKAVYERIRAKEMQEGEVVTMNTAYRDVAVSLIDKLFGLNAVVDTSMARSKNGNQSSLMDRAEGKEISNTYSYMNDTGKGHAALLQQIMVNEQYLVNGMDYEFNEEQKKQRIDYQKKEFVNINSAQFLESTYNLAALDIIVGHVDRHEGNIMLTKDGVKGIDNDSAFSLRKIEDGQERFEGKTEDITRKDIDKMKEENGVEVMGDQALLFFNKAFPAVTEEFRQKILGVSDSAIRGTLKGLIPDDEIQACVDRTEKLQKYLRGVKIVDSFEEVDRDAYSSEFNFSKHVSTNIMSQVRAAGGSVNLENDQTIQNMVKGGSLEVAALESYVRRMSNIRSLTVLNKVVFYMLKELADIAGKEGVFDMYTALQDGTMVGIYDRAMQAANAKEEEKNK